MCAATAGTCERVKTLRDHLTTQAMIAETGRRSGTRCVNLFRRKIRTFVSGRAWDGQCEVSGSGRRLGERPGVSGRTCGLGVDSADASPLGTDRTRRSAGDRRGSARLSRKPGVVRQGLPQGYPSPHGWIVVDRHAGQA